MIKYIGSKRRIVPNIVAEVAACEGASRVLDLFSGTSRVGHALKRLGYRVHANDHNAYAETLARCYVAVDARRWRARANALIAELDALRGAPGWFTETYALRSRYFTPENAARVDAIRSRIADLALGPELESIALTSLMEAADRVDSTVGLQMAYLKRYAPRALQPLQLRLPEILDGEGAASGLEAIDCANAVEADVAYVDPPYNQHSYLGNYHVWESLVRWDKPDVYGVACKRVDCRVRKSAFNFRAGIEPALRAVLGALRARWLVVSYNDEGTIPLSTMRELLGGLGELREAAISHPRYVGHQIGIYDPDGEKVGVPGAATNHEHLFVVDRAGVRAGVPR